MLGHRVMTMEDYTGILRRRMWLVIVPAIVLSGAAYLVSLKLPKRYESKTTVLVEAQRVSGELVKSLETGDPSEKLASMKEQIMSNSRLQPIVERFGLFNDSDLSIDARVAELQKNIGVVPIDQMAGTRPNTLPGFRISVTLSDPRLAQQVCGEITSMFVEEDLKGRERESVNTKDFMGEQVESAKAKMDEQDAKLAQFKQQFLGALPDQEAANLSLLAGINTQIDTVNQALAREESTKGLFESELAQRQSDFKAAQARGVTGTTSPATMDLELKRKEDELAALQDKFADNFPNVVAKKQEIEDLKKKMAAAAAAPPPSEKKDKPDAAANAFVIEPEAIQQLKARIKGSDLTIQDKERELGSLQAQYKLYQSRVQLSPVVEQKYSELTRDTKAAQEDYNQLLHKKTEADMSVALQRRQQGEQFKLLDPAGFPDRPTFPNPLLFAGGGFAGGLILGVALALLLEVRDKSLRTESDVESMLKVPILAMVPVMEKQLGTASRVVFRAGSGTPTLPVNG
jgi:polysaccharide chain length determinant protein (PEP-CTERM system associated)